MILVFANSGAYLFRHKDYIEEPTIWSRFDKHLIKRDYDFFKLKEGVHNIDAYDRKVWCVADNIDRFELMLGAE